MSEKHRRKDGCKIVKRYIMCDLFAWWKLWNKWVREYYETRENLKRMNLTTHARTCTRIIRGRKLESLARLAWADTQKGFRHRPFADADLIVPDSRTRWRFLPRGRARVNAISAYCLSCTRARERPFLQKPTCRASTPYEIAIILLP